MFAGENGFRFSRGAFFDAFGAGQTRYDLPTVVAKQVEKKPASRVDEIGCVVFLLAAAGGILWVLWASAFGCFLADNFDYVTKECALALIQKQSCNSLDRDILAVDEVTTSNYMRNGVEEQARTVIYRYRKRPTNGPVSAEIFRDTEYLFKNRQREWQASCGVLPQQLQP